MKTISIYILILATAFSFAQDNKEKIEAKIAKSANNYVYQANDLVNNDDFVSAEMEYRKALSTQPTNTAGAYNLGHSYYNKGNYDEALYRNKQAVKNAKNKPEKHKAYHNIGNILMQNKKCREAVEAYKNALRNNPKDDESRYNLGLAKECAKNQEPPQEEDDNKDKNKDKKEDENKDDKKEQEDQGENKQDEKDKGNDDKKEGEDKEDKGKPKEEEEKDGKGDKDKKQQQKPQQQPGQLSPQQIKNLLEAMNNQEQKVQEKMNAKKAKGVKIKTDKDW